MMEFYISLYQLTLALDHLKGGFQYLSERAYRLSPRSAQANREVFYHCAQSVQALESHFNNKTDFSKHTLKHTALLFQLLESCHQRLILLSGAAENGVDDNKNVEVVWPLLGLAKRHFRILWEILSEKAGSPVVLSLPVWVGTDGRNLPTILQREETLRQENQRILEKVMGVFDQDPDLMTKLLLIRKDLLDARGILKHIA